MRWSRELRVARRGLRTALRAATAMAMPPAVSRPSSDDGVRAGQLTELTEFGTNPGNLAMLAYRPAVVAMAGAPVIVLLHGCGQDAVEFAVHASWTSLADDLGLTVVLPTQSAENNRHRCFQWFRPAQVNRGMGEAESIRQMVDAAVQRFDADPHRVFIVGLSAGGAMAASMLAAYPDVFAAGATVAGLPVGAADGAALALARMAQAGPERSPVQWQDQVRRAAPADYAGPWPRLSIWHGTGDHVVDPANAHLLARQWCALHGIAEDAGKISASAIARHESWGPPARPAVEMWAVHGMAHGYPVATDGHGDTAVLQAGIDATSRIAGFWGLR